MEIERLKKEADEVIKEVLEEEAENKDNDFDFMEELKQL